jgi:hypothetical protein
VPILALAHEHDPDPEMRPYEKPISAESREKLIVRVAAGVMAIYKYFEAQRLLGTRLHSATTTSRRIAPKIGRNDLCPCGSGQDYIALKYVERLIGTRRECRERMLVFGEAHLRQILSAYAAYYNQVPERDVSSLMRLGCGRDDPGRRALLQPVKEQRGEQERRQVVDRQVSSMPSAVSCRPPYTAPALLRLTAIGQRRMWPPSLFSRPPP